MECYICNKDSVHENHCEFHRYALDPLQRFMAEITGDTCYTQERAPFLNIKPEHINIIKGFISGARLELDIIQINNSFRLTAIDHIYFNYLPINQYP